MSYESLDKCGFCSLRCLSNKLVIPARQVPSSLWSSACCSNSTLAVKNNYLQQLRVLSCNQKRCVSELPLCTELIQLCDCPACKRLLVRNIDAVSVPIWPTRHDAQVLVCNIARQPKTLAKACFKLIIDLFNNWRRLVMVFR